MSLRTREPEIVPDELWAAFFAGNRQACARVLTLAENRPDLLPEIRDRFAGRMGKALRIGITGPPGVGKSTLTGALAIGLAEQGRKVGIVAVDPSSPFSGGAFMGDRIRMEGLVGNPNVFVRSMASRRGRGGLSPSTPYVADVLEGFGMDRILIETVGVGQAELDVMACADLVVLVLQPSTGDVIQTLKAGIIEAADVIVINKSDLPGVDSLLQSLRFLFSLSGPLSDKAAKKLVRKLPATFTASATNNVGINEIVEELEVRANDLIESGRHQEMRRVRIETEIREAIRQSLWERYNAEAGVEQELARHAAELAASGDSPYPYIRELCSRIELRANHGPENA